MFDCNCSREAADKKCAENPIWTLAEKYGLKNTYSNYSSILTYNETGYVDYSELLDEYAEANDKMAATAGRLLVTNAQDQTARAGLALAGWNPKHSDMARQAVEWWSWGKLDLLEPCNLETADMAQIGKLLLFPSSRRSFLVSRATTSPSTS